MGEAESQCCGVTPTARPPFPRHLASSRRARSKAPDPRTRSASRPQFRRASAIGNRSRADAEYSLPSAACCPPHRARASLGRLRSEEHTSELQSRENLVCRLLLEKKKKKKTTNTN